MAPVVLLAVCVGVMAVVVVGLRGTRTQEQCDRLALTGAIAAGLALGALFWLAVLHPPH